MTFNTIDNVQERLLQFFFVRLRLRPPPLQQPPVVTNIRFNKPFRSKNIIGIIFVFTLPLNHLLDDGRCCPCPGLHTRAFFLDIYALFNGKLTFSSLFLSLESEYHRLSLIGTSPTLQICAPGAVSDATTKVE